MVVRYIKVTFVTIFVLVVGLISTVNIKGAEIPGYPPNLTDWYSKLLAQDYYHMTTDFIEIDNNRSVITVYVPEFSNVITSFGDGSEQRIIFLDINGIEIKRVYNYGQITGWLNYQIPENAYVFEYSVLVQGPLSSNYVTEWNNVAWVGYGDLLDIYQQAWFEGRASGYADGRNDYGYYDIINEDWLSADAWGWFQWDVGESVGYDNGYSIGYDEGQTEGESEGYDSGYNYGYNLGYNEGVATNTDFSFTGLLVQVFNGMGSILTIEILPSITIGAIVAVPLVFGIIYFILGKRGKD